MSNDHVKRTTRVVFVLVNSQIIPLGPTNQFDFDFPYQQKLLTLSTECEPSRCASTNYLSSRVTSRKTPTPSLIPENAGERRIHLDSGMKDQDNYGKHSNLSPMVRHMCQVAEKVVVAPAAGVVPDTVAAAFFSFNCSALRLASALMTCFNNQTISLFFS